MNHIIEAKGHSHCLDAEAQREVDAATLILMLMEERDNWKARFVDAEEGRKKAEAMLANPAGTEREWKTPAEVQQKQPERGDRTAIPKLADGEVYAGLSRDPDTGAWHHLVLLPDTMRRECWKDGALICFYSAALMVSKGGWPPPPRKFFFGANVGPWNEGHLIGDREAMEGQR